MLTTIGLAQLNDLTKIFVRHSDGGGHVGLMDFLHSEVCLVLVGEVVRVGDDGLGAVLPHHLEGYGGRCDDDVCTMLLTQAILEHGAMQCAQEAQAPTCSQRIG